MKLSWIMEAVLTIHSNMLRSTYSVHATPYRGASATKRR